MIELVLNLIAIGFTACLKSKVLFSHRSKSADMQKDRRERSFHIDLENIADNVVDDRDLASLIKTLNVVSCRRFAAPADFIWSVF